MMLQADSHRLAIARLCAQVPGASSASRRSSGRPRSESSSSVRSVVMRVADSASGITSMASAALASAMSEPSSALATIVIAAQPCSRPTVIEARMLAPATTATVTYRWRRRRTARMPIAPATPPTSPKNRMPLSRSAH